MTTVTHDKDLAAQKLRSAISLTDKLIAGEWPYDDSSDALKAIKGEFEKKLRGLDSLADASEEIVRSWCTDARSIVIRYHTFIGVILRSSNIRNGFESYSPIREFAKQLLGEGHKVILGSEWSYTPFVYPVPTTSLENYIFVGLPASEAQNALLTPIAGHELGHAVWRRTSASAPIRHMVRENILQWSIGSGSGQAELFSSTPTREEAEKDLRIRSAMRRPYEIAMRQCEEIFCDVIGCWLFGDGFLHAFRYLTVPLINARPSELYPNHLVRAQILVAAATKFHGTAYPLDKLIPHPQEQISPELKLADEITLSVADLIIDTVESYCSSKGISKPTSEGIAASIDSLRKLRPAENLSTVADVIIAGWQLRLELDGWKVPGVDPAKKIDILNDLVFKTFEVDEIVKRERQTCA